MSTPNPVPASPAVGSTLEAAAAPSLIAVLQAVQTFLTNMGTDPSKWAATFPGALEVMLGSIELQAPGLVSAEAAALQSLVSAKLSSAISSLQAKATAS